MTLADPLPALRDDDLAVLLAASLAGLAFVGGLFPDYLKRRTGHGIAALQLAWSPARAAAVLTAWRTRSAIGAARRSLLTDIPFIALYVAAFVTATVLVEHAAHTIGAHDTTLVHSVVKIGTSLAVAAAVCDLLEDLGLAFELFAGPVAGVVPATTLFATLKFGLLTAALLLVSALAVLVGVCWMA